MSYPERTYFQYLPVGSSNMEWEWYITGAGVTHVEAGEVYPPPGHPGTYDFKWEKGRILPEYQIFFLSQGEGTFESSQMGEVDIYAGDAVLLFPGLWHRYRPNRDTGWRDHWISWNGEYLYRLAKRGHISPERAVLRTNPLNILLSLHERLLAMMQDYPGESSRVLAAMGMELLATIIESAEEKPVQPAARRVQQQRAVEDKVVTDAMQHIWTHGYRRASGIEQLLEHLPVTRRTLERRFRAALGCSVGEEFVRCRVERAKHLLSNTKIPIEHIALAVGFSNSGRLRKAFQQSEKTTPSAYRKKFIKDK